MEPIGNVEQLPIRKNFIKEGIGTINAITVGGEPWFFRRDLVYILGYSAISRLKHVEKKKVFCGSQTRIYAVINGKELYALIHSSMKPIARKFEQWITNEVIPMLTPPKRTSTPPELVERTINTPDCIIHLSIEIKKKETQ